MAVQNKNASLSSTIPPDGKELLLAEYQALSEEKLKRAELQHQLLSFALVAFGALLAAGLQAKSALIILVYPFLAMFLSAAWTYNEHRVRQIGAFIRYRIEARMGNKLGWEHFRTKLHSGPLGSWEFLAARGIFIGSGLIAIVLGALTGPITQFGISEKILFALAALSVILTMVILLRTKISIKALKELNERDSHMDEDEGRKGLESADVTTIRDETIKCEQQFAKNGYTGDHLGPSILHIEGSTPIVLSAPHAVRHYRRDRSDPEDADIYTGALAMQLASLTKASALIYARTSKEDPNDDVDGEYKRQLRDLVTQKQARFVLDFHGLAQKQPMQIAVGTGGNRENLLGRTNLLDVLRNTLENAGFEVAEDAPGFAASGTNTISSFTGRELGIPALQIEVNKDYRDPRHKPDEYAKLLYALKKAIGEIAEILKKEH